jgi:hypothetical protein
MAGVASSASWCKSSLDCEPLKIDRFCFDESGNISYHEMGRKHLSPLLVHSLGKKIGS